MAARWVTPRQRDVTELVARARVHVRRGRLAGYSPATGDSVAIARHVRDQAEAVFRGVRYGDAREILYLDLTVLPKGSFESAVDRAHRHLSAVPSEEVLVVDIAAARALRIFPLVDESFS